MYNRKTGRVVSSRKNVTFVEQAARSISNCTQATWGRGKCDADNIFELSTDDDKMKNSPLKTMYTTELLNY